jgi:hypothetical protein
VCQHTHPPLSDTGTGCGDIAEAASGLELIKY